MMLSQSSMFQKQVKDEERFTNSSIRVINVGSLHGFRILVRLEMVFYTKKTLQGTYWDFTSKINNLTKEGAVEFSNGKNQLILLSK